MSLLSKTPINDLGERVRPGHINYNGHEPVIIYSGEHDFERDKLLYGADGQDYNDERTVIKRFPGGIPRAIHLQKSTNHHFKALTEKRTNGAFPVAGEGLILTADDYFLFGIRGHGAGVGMLLTAPAGCVSGEGPLASFFAETAEETGIQVDELRNVHLLGHQIDNGLGIYIFHTVYAAETTKTLAQIQTHHAKSLARYNTLHNDCCWHPALIRDRLELEGHMADPWEYTAIVGIPRKDISTIVNQQPTRLQRVFSPNTWREYKNIPLLNIGARPLQMWHEQNQ